MAYHERRRRQLMQVPGRRCQLAQRPPAASAETCCRYAGTAARSRVPLPGALAETAAPCNERAGSGRGGGGAPRRRH